MAEPAVSIFLARRLGWAHDPGVMTRAEYDAKFDHHSKAAFSADNAHMWTGKAPEWYAEQAQASAYHHAMLDTLRAHGRPAK